VHPVNELASKPKRQWLATAAWIAAAVVVLLAALPLIYPAVFTIRDRVRRIDLETRALRAALGQYKEQFGRFPDGDSRAVCRALSGNNSKGIRFISWGEGRKTPEGDFLDPWGTPYKIYFSGDWPLIRSAGENRQFDSSDQKATDDYFGG
jgi:hypothetical protein